MSNEDDHGSRIIRSVIAGGLGVLPTLAGIEISGLMTDLGAGAFACFVSFFGGFIIRLAIEYGVQTPSSG